MAVGFDDCVRAADAADDGGDCAADAVGASIGGGGDDCWGDDGRYISLRVWSIICGCGFDCNWDNFVVAD